MKRSEVNNIMKEADAFMKSHGFFLPPFAYWTPDEWRAKGPEVREIVQNQMGWDITDFGQGNYEQFGLFLFTLRNGSVANLRSGRGKTYAEKVLIVDVDQITPMHFHWDKTEDIINRGGGGWPSSFITRMKMMNWPIPTLRLVWMGWFTPSKPVRPLY